MKECLRQIMKMEVLGLPGMLKDRDEERKWSFDEILREICEVCDFLKDQKFSVSCRKSIFVV